MKKLKPKASLDELCYPFIYEDSKKCDYEIITDQLCRSVGAALPHMEDEFPEVHKELSELQPLIFHLNGSIRGKLAITETDLQWLLSKYHSHQVNIKDCLEGFVLPRGQEPVGILNQCSSLSKQAIRLMVHIHNNEALEVPDVLPRFTNLLCNYFFTLTLVINKARGHVEIPFESKSY